MYNKPISDNKNLIYEDIYNKSTAKAEQRKMAKKYYVLMDGNDDTEHVFVGSSPRQAALKVATRVEKLGNLTKNNKEIRLRNRSRRNQDKSNSVHVYEGKVERIKAPDNAPEWMPKEINKPSVKKIRVERVKL